MNNQEINYQYNERLKELKCIYETDRLLADQYTGTADILRKLTMIIPDGWQYPEICKVRIIYKDSSWQTPYFTETGWYIDSDITTGDLVSGKIQVFYTMYPDSAGPELFLPQEIQLLSSITSRVGLFLYHREIEGLLQNRQQNLVMKQHENIHWKWRNEMVGLMMKHIKPDEFGIISVYLIGSTKNGNSGPASDIDLVVHHTGDHAKTNAMKQWFEGWSLCLAYMNFRQTGYRMDDGIIDLHLIRDEDIEKRTSYATMIGSCMNSAKQIYTRKND